jgi:drug/metabolite transporter (DMT)-like permease
MLWHRSIRDVGPGLATLLGNFQVFVMALAGVFLYRERLGARFLAGLALAFAGIWLLVGVDWNVLQPQYRLGVLFGILTGIAYAAYMLSFRHAQRRPGALGAIQLLCLNSLLCAAMLGGAVVAEHESFAIPDLRSLSSLLALGLVGQVLGWTLIVRAIPLLPVSLVGLLLLLQPSLSFVLDVLLFARPTSAQDWIGVAVSLCGIYLGSTRAPAAADAARRPA